MPEGPTLVILRDATQGFVGRRIVAVSGNTRLEIEPLVGQRVGAIRSFGKTLLIELADRTVRVHFMLFGSYAINARKEKRRTRLRLMFDDGQELNFYACSLRYLTGDLAAEIPWEVDVLSPAWNARGAMRTLRRHPRALVCDALLDQTIFAGAGNIIKNEVLFRMRIHPLTKVGDLPDRKLRAMVHDVRTFSFLFLDWKRRFVARKHWQAHRRRECPRDRVPLERSVLGVRRRNAFYCPHCQILYGPTSDETPKTPRARNAPAKTR